MERIRKFSRKREAIKEAIASTTSHPNAEWIYEKLKPNFPDLSLGTVYRNLRLFKESGDVISVGSVNGQERFDGNVSPHAHFICSRCGVVQDVMEGATPPIPHTTGRIEGYQLNYYGVCQNCCEEEAKEKASGIN